MARMLAFDIGGTFTDVVVLDTQSEDRIRTAKVLTTPADPTDAVAEGFDRAVGGADVPVDRVVHATTLATNALIEGRGARTALLVTAGFRDVLEMGYERRWDTYDIDLQFTPPLVERSLRFEVPERVAADGAVVTPLSEAAVRKICTLLRERNVESVAVCFLHSYRNPTHEQMVGAIIRDELPLVSVSLSSDVMPAIREYERTTTVTANAYVRPIIERYFTRLVGRLAERGYREDVLIMQSNGGTADAGTAGRYPVRMIESGPAAGAIAAAAFARSMGMERMLAFDMGGTTAKVCVINKFRPDTSTELEVARAARAKRGSGIPIRVPSVELIEIGAGGGSIAQVNRMGLLQVGPESAGAAPGPVCYGRGGTRPTVTDANVLLGYIGAGSFLGGDMTLDVDAARNAVEAGIAGPLGIGAIEAAQGIFEIVNDNMAGAARVHAIERGVDPRRYPLFAFGGAGPVHAYYVAQKLGIDTVVVPAAAGTLSALGLLVAPVGMDFVRSHVGRVDRVERSAVERLFQDMTEQAIDLLGRAGIAAAEIEYRRTADMRYVGQGYEVTVELPASDFRVQWSADEEAVKVIREAFEAAYVSIYGISNPQLPVEVLNWRLVATGGEILPFEDLMVHAKRAAGETRSSVRPCYFPGDGLVMKTPVYDHHGLTPGEVYAGPAIVEQSASTTVVGPGGRFWVDDYRRLKVTVAPERLRSAGNHRDR